MEEKIINGITVYYKNGLKYRKDKDGCTRLLCFVTDCITAVDKRNGYHCVACLNELSYNDPDKRKDIIDIYVSKVNKIIEESIVVINGVEIYTKNSKKYKKSGDTFVLVCMYEEGCSLLQQEGTFCIKHRNGTSPNSVEKIKSREKTSEIRKQNGNKTCETGDATESWVLNELKLLNNIYDIDKIGYTGSIYDITFKLIGETKSRGIQIKTLIKEAKTKDYYCFFNDNDYSDNILFIGVNKERTRFILGYFKDFKDKVRHGFNFLKTDPSYRYKENMFTDYNLFIKKLKVMLLTTDICITNDIKQKWVVREAESLKRIAQRCQELGLLYSRVKKADSRIDCIINNYNFQHKATESVDKKTYNCHIVKNGNGKKTPYSDKDGIHYFIFELIPFKNNFYIVPIEELVKRGFIKTNNTKGKKELRIPNPETGNKDHWINKYLNNFDLLKTPKNIEEQ